MEYYYANKEAISQKRKDKYKQLSPDDKKKLLEYNRQTPERQLEFRQKAKKYQKYRYDNMIEGVS